MNGRHPLLHHVAATIRSQGLYTQAVLSTYPGEVDFAYAVGNHERGPPELIVVGLELGAATRLLHEVADLLWTGRSPAASDTHIDGKAIGLPAPVSLRLGQVAPRWARQLGRIAFNRYERDDPDAIAFLQVVLCDERGRFWHEDGYSTEMDQFQPDLSRERDPWRRPHILWADRDDPPQCDKYALVPIIVGGEEKERSEAVPASMLGDDLVRIERPPVMADWVTTGAELRVNGMAISTEPSLPDGRAYVRVERESPQVHQVWWMHVHNEAEYTELVERIRDELDLPRITMVTTNETVHVAAPPRQAPRVRSRMRRLVRDGLAQEWEPYHRGAIRCHPDCFEYQSQWP